MTYFLQINTNTMKFKNKAKTRGSNTKAKTMQFKNKTKTQGVQQQRCVSWVSQTDSLIMLATSRK